MIDLSLVKEHLLIDQGFTSDDLYLEQLIKVAECSVTIHLNLLTLDEIKDAGGQIPAPIVQAALLMAGSLYRNRESVVDKTLVKLPLGYEYLISLYKKY